jgi:hypothetical protein
VHFGQEGALSVKAPNVPDRALTITEIPDALFQERGIFSCPAPPPAVHGARLILEQRLDVGKVLGACDGAFVRDRLGAPDHKITGRTRAPVERDRVGTDDDVFNAGGVERS